MESILTLILAVINIYWWIVIGSAIMSWLLAFRVINPSNQLVSTIGTTLYKLTEPALRPIRNILPDLGGIDLSPLVLLLGLFFLRTLIYNNYSMLVG